MKLTSTLIALLICTSLFSQKEGQNFCSEFGGDNYFPLTIKKKIIVWYDSQYVEEIVGTMTMDGTKYIAYAQTWEKGNIEELLLRNEGGAVYQYEDCCNSETLRYHSDFKVGAAWFTADKKTKYTVVTYEGSLKTPFCQYDDLLVIEGRFTEITFQFYYKKGYGYVGATESGQLVSFVSPK